MRIIYYDWFKLQLETDIQKHSKIKNSQKILLLDSILNLYESLKAVNNKNKRFYSKYILICFKYYFTIYLSQLFFY